MARLRVHGFIISVDGYAAGPDLFDDPADSAGPTFVEHVATPSATS
jgi:hypothetical protein